MKLFKSGLLVFSIAILTACGNYVEEFSLKADGSGSYKMYTDIISGSIEMSATMAEMFSPDSLSPMQKDSLKQAVAEEIWADFDGEIDSVLDYTSEMPDSFLNYGSNREYAERIVMFMRGSKEKGYVNIGMEIDYKDSDDFSEFMKYMGNMQNSTGALKENGNILESLSSTKTEANYKFSEKRFKREVGYITNEEAKEGIGKVAEMFGNGTYQTIVNTERKIKKVKGDHIKIQEDYLVIFEYSYLEAINGELNTDFEIIFE